MTTNEYIDAISRDLQDLITALDRDPHTSALAKGRAKKIQERINYYYNSIFDESRLTQIPDAPPYKIGDEDYKDRVTCEQYSPYLKDNGADWSCLRDEWWYYDSRLS